jgi:hypothetical protein
VIENGRRDRMGDVTEDERARKRADVGLGDGGRRAVAMPATEVHVPTIRPSRSSESLVRVAHPSRSSESGRS